MYSYYMYMYELSDWSVIVFADSCLFHNGQKWNTVDDSGVGQRQLNGTSSKTILKWSEYHEIHRVFFYGLNWCNTLILFKFEQL